MLFQNSGKISIEILYPLRHRQNKHPVGLCATFCALCETDVYGVHVLENIRLFDVHIN